MSGSKLKIASVFSLTCFVLLASEVSAQDSRLNSPNSFASPGLWNSPDSIGSTYNPIEVRVIDTNTPFPSPYSDETKSLTKSIHSLVRERMYQYNVPGYALAVVQRGEVIVRHSYGMASLEQKQQATCETVFGLASITKTFTALVLLSLVDKGLIALDDPLDKYIRNLTPQYRTLTIRQLASMRAGVTNEMNPERPWPAQIEPLIETPLVSQPDSQYLYSNFSYRLLGQVIENVTGKSYMQNVNETVFQPIGMNTSGTVESLARSGMVAQPYGDQNGAGPLRAIRYKPPIVTFSAGMIASNLDDMLKYTLALMNRKLLSPEGYNTLWYSRPPLSTGEPANWAFGWGSKLSPAYGGKRCVSMNGGVPGIASSIIMLPEEGSAVIALSNLRKPPVYAIAAAVAKLVFGQSSNIEPENEQVMEQNGAGGD